MIFSFRTNTPNKMYRINPFFEEEIPLILKDGHTIIACDFTKLSNMTLDLNGRIENCDGIIPNTGMAKMNYTK